MTTERSDAVWDAWRDSSDKFDYFVTGLALALVGYLGADLEPVRLGLNSATVEVASVLSFLGAAITGLLRIETNVSVLGATQRRVYLEEMAGSMTDAALKPGTHLNTATGEVMTAATASLRAQAATQAAGKVGEKLETEADRSEHLYTARTWLLSGGLVLLIVSRILPAYLPPPG